MQRIHTVECLSTAAPKCLRCRHCDALSSLINDVLWDFCGWCFGFASLKMFFIIKFMHMEKCNRKWNGKILRDIFTFYGFSSPTLRITDEGSFLLVSVEVLQNFLLQFLQSFALQAINHHDGISFFFFSAWEKQETSSTNLIFVFGDLSQILNALWCLISRPETEKGSIKVHPNSEWPTVVKSESAACNKCGH